MTDWNIKELTTDVKNKAVSQLEGQDKTGEWHIRVQ